MAETARLARRSYRASVVLDAGRAARVRAQSPWHRRRLKVRTEAAARALQLRVVDGSVQIPDLRLDNGRARARGRIVDPELATEHYKPGQVAAAGGFTIYASPSPDRPPVGGASGPQPRRGDSVSL